MSKPKYETILDVECPKCGSTQTGINGTDEIDFSPDGTGVYNADCYCPECNTTFRMYYKFKYTLTDEYCRH